MITIHDPRNPLTGYSNIYEASYSLYKMMLGFVTSKETWGSDTLFRFVFIVFLAQVVLLILNMLIGAMSETYSSMAIHQDRLWTRGKSAAILLWESRLGMYYMKLAYRRYTIYDKKFNMHEIIVETSDPATCK